MTGLPATMESSIFKSGAVTAGPAILDYQVNGRLPGRIANRGTDNAPMASTSARATTAGAP